MLRLQHLFEAFALRSGPRFLAGDGDRDIVAEQLPLTRQQDRHGQDEENGRGREDREPESEGLQNPRRCLTNCGKQSR